MTKAPNWSQEKYIHAYRFAAKAHRGQLYPGTGLPYLIYISFVSMEIIAALAVEEAAHPNLAVQCALLHDVLEDTEVSKQKLDEEFGTEVANGVDALSKKLGIKESQRLRESLDRIREQPREVGMVKLADHISNLQPPPFDWKQEKIKAYRESSKKIHDDLNSDSPYLEKRLQENIQNHEQYII